jgi:hypothetical protein
LNGKIVNVFMDVIHRHINLRDWPEYRPEPGDWSGDICPESMELRAQDFASRIIIEDVRPSGIRNSFRLSGGIRKGLG